MYINEAATLIPTAVFVGVSAEVPERGVDAHGEDAQ